MHTQKNLIEVLLEVRCLVMQKDDLLSDWLGHFGLPVSRVVPGFMDQRMMEYGFSAALNSIDLDSVGSPTISHNTFFTLRRFLSFIMY